MSTTVHRRRPHSHGAQHSPQPKTHEPRHPHTAARASLCATRTWPITGSPRHHVTRQAIAIHRIGAAQLRDTIRRGDNASSASSTLIAHASDLRILWKSRERTRGDIPSTWCIDGSRPGAAAAGKSIQGRRWERELSHITGPAGRVSTLTTQRPYRHSVCPHRTSTSSLPEQCAWRLVGEV